MAQVMTNRAQTKLTGNREFISSREVKCFLLLLMSDVCEYMKMNQETRDEVQFIMTKAQVRM